MSYYNTTNVKGADLKVYRKKAQTQDERINEYFRPDRKLSASLVVRLFDKTPITSIRRSLNSLENKGIIEKTGLQINGCYGRKENLYRLVKKL